MSCEGTAHYIAATYNDRSDVANTKQDGDEHSETKSSIQHHC